MDQNSNETADNYSKIICKFSPFKNRQIFGFIERNKFRFRKIKLDLGFEENEI